MTPSTSRSSGPTFLDLPGEIRNRIYTYFIPSGYIDIAKISSLDSSQISSNALAKNIHPQITVEWRRLAIQSAIFLVHHCTSGTFLPKSAHNTPGVTTARNGGDAWVVWLRNLKECEAKWVKKVVFWMPAFVVKVGIGKEGIIGFEVRLQRRSFEKYEDGALPVTVYVDEKEVYERLKRGFGEVEGMVELRRKEVLNHIFWTVVDLQIWMDPGYLPRDENEHRTKEILGAVAM